MQKWKEKFNRN